MLSVAGLTVDVSFHLSVYLLNPLVTFSLLGGDNILSPNYYWPVS
jgi:hypothetical protein